MSRRTSGPDQPGPDNEGPKPRRSRRAGRSGGANDFTEMFGNAPTNDVPAHGSLHEPTSADRYVRGRTRLTVRELMEQMNAEGTPGDPTPPTATPGDTTRPGGTPPRTARPQPRADDPTEVHRLDELAAAPGSSQENDVTQKIAPIKAQATFDDVDLSDDATRKRVTEESRGQGGPAAGNAAGGAAAAAAAVAASSSTPSTDTPSAPAPSAGTPSAGTPSAGTPSAGTPSAGTPSASAPTTGTPSTGQEPVRAYSGTPSPDISPSGTASSTPSPSTGSPSAGSSSTPPPSAPSRSSRVPRRPLQPTPDLSDTIPPRSRPRRHPSSAGDRPRRNLTRSVTVTGRIIVAIACVMALVGTGFVWGYLKSWNGNWKTINAVNPEDSNIRKKDAQYGDENYLIVGTDTRSGQNSNVGAGTTADAEGARSDTIILVNIPANRERVVAVSFPRDLQVDRPDCQQWDNDSGTYGEDLPAESSVKINSVYADGGPKCLVSVITAMSGLNINHFIAMDFYGFEKVVRSVGGVEVCSPTPLYDYELGQILRKPGRQKLTGKRALNYVRARSIASEGNGDYGRIKRQQLFMSSLLRSTLSGNVLSNPSKLNSIVNTFIQYSYVDGVDTQSLLDLADSMQGIEAGRVTFLTIPTSGTSTDGQNNEIPRTDDINAIFNAIIDDDPLPGEQAKKDTSTSSSTSAKAAGASSPTTSSAPTRISATAQSPGNVGVRVLNGTGRSGAATDVSDQLAPLGFDVRGVADASENRTDTVIRYGTGEQDAAATLAEVFPGASIQLDRTVKSGVEVILGSSFTGSVGSVPAAGTTISVEQLPPATNTSGLPNDLAVTNAANTDCS